MDQAELDSLVTDLQDKRMLTRKRYEEAELARKKTQDEKLRAQMETVLRRMAKSLATIEKQTDKFQKDYSQVMTMRSMAVMLGEGGG